MTTLCSARIWRLQAGRDRGQVRDGRFVLHGLEPDAEVPVYFLEPRRKLGASVRLSGRSAGNGSVTVRLEPCGTAHARLITPDGKPLGNYPTSSLISMIITPGPPSRPPSRKNEPKDGPLFADESPVARLDPVNYGGDFRSDGEAKVTFPGLVPGAAYRIIDRTPIFGGRPLEVRREFTIQPGKSLHVGDIIIARPRD